MKYVQIPGIDLPVSRLFFGTAMDPINDGADCDELFDSMYELGINTYDTARVYGDAEGSLGKWIRRRGMEGKIGLFGGSNWTIGRLQEANEYAAAHDLQPFSVSSPYFALAEQRKAPWGGGCQSMAWIHHQGLNTFAAISSHSTERMKLNIAALDLELTMDEINYLDLREQ